MKNKLEQFKEFIKLLIYNDRQVCIDCLIIIYDNQTFREKCEGNTNERNNIGFNSTDSEILSSIAKQYKYSKKISNKQLEICHRHLPKYWRQYYNYNVENRKVNFDVKIKHYIKSGKLTKLKLIKNV